MSLSSLSFIFLFFPLSLLSLFSPRRIRPFVFLAFNIIFAIFNGLDFFITLILTILISYFFAAAIEKSEEGRAKTRLILGIVLHAAIFAAYFLYSYLNAELQVFSFLNVEVTRLFAVFAFLMVSAGYLIEIYQKKHRAERNFIHHFNFISMFFFMRTGIIHKYSDVKSGLYELKTNSNKFSAGLSSFIEGLAIKTLITAPLWIFISESTSISQMSGFSVLSSWLAVLTLAISFFLELYSWSQMGVGMALIFGFDTGANYESPFHKKTITDFCLAFNISLTNWFLGKDEINLKDEKKQNTLLLSFSLIFVSCFFYGLIFGISASGAVWGGIIAAAFLAEFYFFDLSKKAKFNAARTIFFVLTLLASFIVFCALISATPSAFIASLFGRGAVPLYDNMALYLLKSVALIILIALCLTAGFFTRILKSLEKLSPFFSRFIHLFLYLFIFMASIAVKLTI